MLAASTEDGIVAAWTISDGHPLDQLDLGRFVHVPAIQWAPHTSQLAIATDEMTVLVWDPTSQRAPRYMKENWGVVGKLQWSPDGFSLAGGMGSQTVRIWDPSTGTTVFEFPHQSLVTDLAWSSDGTYLAVATQSHGISLWSPTTGQRLRYLVSTPGEPVSAVSWSPDGTMLASLEPNIGATLWETTDWVPTLVREGPTGRTIRWRQDSSALIFALRQTYCVLAPPTDTDPYCPSAPLEGLASIEWSPDGKTLLVAPAWPAVQIVDAGTHLRLASIAHATYVRQADWSPRGDYIAIGLLSGIIEIWTLD